MAIERKHQKLVITLDNVKQSDAIALLKMFKYMQYLGSVGASRMCSFYADGDGDFHPKVSFEYPEELPEVPEITGEVEWNTNTKKLSRIYNTYEGDFIIDSDEIAWKIYHDPEPEGFIREKNPQEEMLNAKEIEYCQCEDGGIWLDGYYDTYCNRCKKHLK